MCSYDVLCLCHCHGSGSVGCFGLKIIGDTVLGLDLSHGGHLTHGHPVTFMAKIYNYARYKTNEEGEIDYDNLRNMALEHKLGVVSHDDRIAEKIMFGCLGQKMITASAATFIWVADIKRMTWRYGQRGYRYILLDAGHICQNLYLAAESIDCGACGIGAFDAREDSTRVVAPEAHCQLQQLSRLLDWLCSNHSCDP